MWVLQWPVYHKLPDLGSAPYVLYGVKYIGPVSLDAATGTSTSNANTAPLDLSRVPYVLYGVNVYTQYPPDCHDGIRATQA